MQPLDELKANIEEKLSDDNKACAIYTALVVTLLENRPKDMVQLPPYTTNREALLCALSELRESLQKYLEKVCDVNAEAKSLFEREKSIIQRQIEKLEENTLKKIEKVKKCKYSERYKERKIREIRRTHEKSQEHLKNKLRAIEEKFENGYYHKRALIGLMDCQESKRALEKIEKEFYQRFRDAALDCVEIEILDLEERKVLVKLLRMVKRGDFKKTPMGSVYITDVNFGFSKMLNLIRELQHLKHSFLSDYNFIEKLKMAGIIQEFHVPSHRDRRFVILGPYLEEGFLRLLEGESDPMLNLLKSIPYKLPEEICFGNESIANIVSQVLRAMGFDVIGINSGDSYADIGAYRLLSGQKFRILVRCKNGCLTANDAKDVAKLISSFPKKPNLVLAIADSVEQDVIEEADKHGIFVVTTGLKANSSDKKVLAEIILSKLSRLVGFGKN